MKVNYLDIALEHVQILERAKPPSKLWIASIVHPDFKGLLYIKHHEIHRLFNGGGVLLPMSVDDCYEQLSLNLEQTGVDHSLQYDRESNSMVGGNNIGSGSNMDSAVSVERKGDQDGQDRH